MSNHQLYDDSVNSTDPDIIEFNQTFGADYAASGDTHGFSFTSPPSPLSVFEVSRAEQAQILGVTEDELAQMLALAPDVSDLEIAEILAIAPQMLLDPDLLITDHGEHPWGNLADIPPEASTNPNCVEPNMTLIKPPRQVPRGELKRLCFEPETSRLSHEEQHALERAKRAQRRAFLRELATQCEKRQ